MIRTIVGAMKRLPRRYLSTDQTAATPLSGGGVKRAVFITGCDSGFGFSLASHMLEESRTKYRDYIVIAGCFYPNGNSAGADQLLETATRVKSEDFHILSLDVTCSDSVAKARDDIDRIVGASEGAHLWAVVNNAATLVFADAVFQTEAMFRRQFEVNVIGAWAISKVSSIFSSNPSNLSSLSK